MTNNSITTYGLQANSNRLTHINKDQWGQTRLIFQKKTESWNNSLTTTYTYDNCPNGKGKLCNVTDPSGRSGFEYDWRGNLRVKTQRIDGTTLTQRFFYNAAGQLTTQLLPSGKALAYGYSGDQLSRINIAGQPYIRNIRYNSNDQITGWQWSNGQAYTRSYDQNARLKTLNLGAATRTLTYDSVNNLTGWQDSDRPQQSTFNYDRINQLTTYNQRHGNSLIEQQTLSYDASGNRTRLNDNNSITTYGLQANSNRLTHINNQTITTDANGNIRNDGNHAYQYDARNRLSQTDNTTYQYNAQNQRVKKNSPAGTTLYAWSTDRIIGEYNSNGTAKSETVYLNDIPVGLLKDGQKYRIYADQIDTPRLITTESNQPLWRWDSKPFGESQPNEDVDGNGQRLSYNLRFPGQYYDAETQTHYNYRRDYSPINRPIPAE